MDAEQTIGFLTGVTLLNSAPIVAGAVVALLCTLGLLLKATHASQLAFGLFFGTALCGSSVFSHLVWDGTKLEIRTALSATSDVATIVADNTKAIKELHDQLTALDSKVALLSVTPAASQDTGSTNLKFPTDSVWGNYLETPFCKTFPASCKGITLQGNDVVVPRSTLEAIENFSIDTTGIGSPSATEQLDLNLQKLQDIQIQLQPQLAQ